MMKRLIPLALFLMLCQGAGAQTAPEEILVGLFLAQTAKESIVIEADGVSTEVAAAGLTGERVFASQDGIVGIGGKRYRGQAVLRPAGDGRMTVINRVGLEDYVASVLSKEMSPGFSMEALKAQAVCARTYAVKNLNKFQAYGFNVCATNVCQMYEGMEAEHERTVAAARETAGQLLTYQGQVVETVYFATSGGHTESAKYVWGSDVPYLQGVPDGHESRDVYGAAWTKEFTTAQISTLMEERGYNLGRITGIEILETSPGGSVHRLRVAGEQGERVFTNEACRTFLGAGGPLSQAYTVQKGSASAAVHAYGGTVAPASVHVLSVSGTEHRRGGALHLLGSEARAVEPGEGFDGFRFTGRGYGHLVGMSQNGAEGMGRAGFTYEQILAHYYQGTQITEKNTDTQTAIEGI